MSARIPTALTAMKIPCCLCGTMILPNGANQCSSCLAQEFDLQTEIQRGSSSNGGELLVYQCRQCRRYQLQQQHKSQNVIYKDMEWESPELLSLCLKSIPALNSHGNNHYHQDSNDKIGTQQRCKIDILDAMWVWTEPHSRRLKLRVTVKADVLSVPIQQRVLVELKIHWQQCSDCNREFTNRTWHGLVQIRQKRDNSAIATTGEITSSGGKNNTNSMNNNNTKSLLTSKKGLSKIEMAICNNPKIRKHVLQMDITKNGFDFYFLHFNQAQAFSNFLTKVVPMRISSQTSKLVSQDVKNNTANMKHTITCDIVPINKDDVILIDKRITSTASGGNKVKAKGISKLSTLSGKVALVTKVASVIHLIDVSPKRNVDNINKTCMAELNPDTYFKMDKNLIPLLFAPHRLIPFVVLDVELCEQKNAQNDHQQQQSSLSVRDDHNYALADVQVARECDFGKNDEIFTCVTHLGNMLQTGDIVLGYDLISSVLSEELQDSNKIQSNYVLPDVILVKKVKKQKKNKQKQKSKNKKNNTTRNNDNVNKNKDDAIVEEDEDEGFVDNSNDDSNNKTKKKKTTKAALRRQRKRQEKKTRELEESAARMGFLENPTGAAPPATIDEIYEDESDDDEDDEDVLDPNLEADLDALEKDLQALEKQQQEQHRGQQEQEREQHEEQGEDQEQEQGHGQEN